MTVSFSEGSLNCLICRLSVEKMYDLVALSNEDFSLWLMGKIDYRLLFVTFRSLELFLNVSLDEIYEI